MLKGIFPPITTPFINNEISFEKLEKNLSMLNTTGISGYVVMGSNGESAFLTRQEKLDLVEGVKNYSSKNKLVIAGTGSDSIKETISLTNEAAERGADYALILTPSFFKEKMGNNSYIEYFSTVADNISIPLIIYNVPKFTGVNIESPAVAKLSEHKNIVGIKSSSENIAHLSEVIYNSKKAFITLAGTASILYPALCVGAQGGVLALANIAPDVCVKIYDLFNGGKLDDSLELHNKMIPVNRAVTAKYGVPGLKKAMDMLGYFGEEPRSPLLKLNDSDTGELKNILVKAELL